METRIKKAKVYLSARWQSVPVVILMSSPFPLSLAGRHPLLLAFLFFSRFASPKRRPSIEGEERGRAGEGPFQPQSPVSSAEGEEETTQEEEEGNCIAAAKWKKPSTKSPEVSRSTKR